MIKEIVEALGQVERAAKNAPDLSKVSGAIKSAKKIVEAAKKQSSGSTHDMLEQLDKELSVWNGKLDVIWKEPAGRQGILKHTIHWKQRLEGS